MEKSGNEEQMISISAVLRSLHIGFENFGRVLTEYDHVITDILNIWQKNGQYKRIAS